MTAKVARVSSSTSSSHDQSYDEGDIEGGGGAECGAAAGARRGERAGPLPNWLVAFGPMAEPPGGAGMRMAMSAAPPMVTDAQQERLWSLGRKPRR